MIFTWLGLRRSSSACVYRFWNIEDWLLYQYNFFDIVGGIVMLKLDFKTIKISESEEIQKFLKNEDVKVFIESEDFPFGLQIQNNSLTLEEILALINNEGVTGLELTSKESVLKIR
ncbi:MAG: hypothetical protein ACRC0G_01300 [Fusobacteriaceae bacterium]